MWVIKANRASTDTGRLLPIFLCLSFPGSSFLGARGENRHLVFVFTNGALSQPFQMSSFSQPIFHHPSTLITFIRKFTATLFDFVVEAQPDKKEWLCTNFVLSGSVISAFGLSHNFSLNSPRFQNFRRFSAGRLW
jgi:hypothetical protein